MIKTILKFGTWLRRRIERWNTYNVFGLEYIGSALYWIRTHTYNPYHLINISKVDTSKDPYRWGWIDRDRAMLFAIWRIFIDYYKQESHQIDWTWNKDYRAAKQEMDALYNYWKVIRLQKLSQIDKAWDECPRMGFVKNKDGLYDMVSAPDPENKAKKAMELEEAFEKEEDENLIRILNLRRYFWS